MDPKFFKCNCSCGVLMVEHDPHLGTQLALFERPTTRSWRNRLRLAWAALRGKPYTDMVILDDLQLKELTEYLQAIRYIDWKAQLNHNATQAVADKLCGYSCGTAVDGIIEYVNRPDVSLKQVNRLSDALEKYSVKTI